MPSAGIPRPRPTAATCSQPQATDTSGNIGKSTNVTVTVQNPALPPPCFIMDAHVTVHGTGAVTTPSFHTAAAGETLLAFVSSDGPAGAGKQTATITGAGLTWTLVKRANAQIRRQRGLEGDCA